MTQLNDHEKGHVQPSPFHVDTPFLAMFAEHRTPSVKEFRDPVGLLLNDAMRLNVSSLNAEVEALNSR